MKSRTEAGARGIPAPRGRSLSTRAFTLLEVLAAVAILGLLYVAFASYAIQGLRQEGENARRSRASLLADRELSDIETELQTGDFPTDDESDEDEFHVKIEVLPITGLEAPGAESDPTAQVQGNLGDFATYLHTIRVQVTWTEGTAEQHVSRTTYAWDVGAFYDSLGLTPPAAANGTSATGDGGDGTDAGTSSPGPGSAP